ncbi:CsbD family protein [Trueperella pecoris]|uniref:CsbD family protein n=1 Tax=Trueperella pecoris TaxID=2733571 RepID=A0A7M1QY78_9ACTO|nr:CsbD family protein [Trueperella pecoris]QOR46823.1 CsbD family protein [Trueperella pecoris]
MSLGDDIKNTTEDLGGKAKEAAGKATDNESLEFEGKKDQMSADIKDKVANAAEKAKGVVNDAIDKLKGDK